jgi:ankyrin repeat protein
MQVVKARDVADPPDEVALLDLLRAIAARDLPETSRMLEASPGLGVAAVRAGSTRQDPTSYFLPSILRHVYRGDTGLHIAAAAYRRPVAELLVAKGADPRARNRRGAEPLHYAADGRRDVEGWDPNAQRDAIEYLISLGSDANAPDNSGVAPLHRAVRTRSSAAVRALLENGAEPRLPNKSGSTPLHLAVQNTGASASGAAAAKDEQRRIIALLLEHGARPDDTDAKGKTVTAAATSDWIRGLLTEGA